MSGVVFYCFNLLPFLFVSFPLVDLKGWDLSSITVRLFPCHGHVTIIHFTCRRNGRGRTCVHEAMRPKMVLVYRVVINNCPDQAWPGHVKLAKGRFSDKTLLVIKDVSVWYSKDLRKRSQDNRKIKSQITLITFSMIALMIIENRAQWLARSLALSRYNHRAVIKTLKASCFQNCSQICWCFGVGNWSI